jgi:hypothetical protein
MISKDVKARAWKEHLGIVTNLLSVQSSSLDCICIVVFYSLREYNLVYSCASSVHLVRR